MGDLKPAIETHEMLYEVAKRHKFIPEVSNDCLTALLSNTQEVTQNSYFRFFFGLI